MLALRPSGLRAAPHRLCAGPNSRCASTPHAAPQLLPAARRLALGAAAAAAVFASRPQALVAQLADLVGGGGGAGGGGGGFGGGSGGGGGWFRAPPAHAAADLFDDDDAEEAPVEKGEQPPEGAAPAEDDDQTFLCDGVKAANLPSGPGIPTQARRCRRGGADRVALAAHSRKRSPQRELFDGLYCQAGAMVSRKQLSEDLSSLLSCVVSKRGARRG